MYIYQNKNWPKFTWDKTKILKLLAKVKLAQGILLGKMQSIGFDIKDEALLQTITEEIFKSNQIEGEVLDTKQIRSSIAKKLGLKADSKIKISRNIDGLVDMTFDSTNNYDKAMSKERLCEWHLKMFPEGNSGLYKIKAGQYRDDKKGPMQIVSGQMGAEKVHYQAPDAKILNSEMEKLISFINTDIENDDVIKAAISHLWFVILHPFDDGNGRIARALTEMLLARSENSANRFYSMSSQIEKNRKGYYKVLEITESSSLNITPWLEWFLNTLLLSIESSKDLLKPVLEKAEFWAKHQGQTFNERQTKMLNMLFSDFKGNLTSTKWAKLCKCSQDTASRDITGLLNRNVLEKIGSGRNTHYKLYQS